MSDSEKFEEIVGRILPPHPGVGTRRTSQGLLERYGGFVRQVGIGYVDNIYEYDNELSLRDFIQRVLDDPELARLAPFGSFAASVSQLDAILAASLTPEPRRRGSQLTPEPRRRGSQWWESRLPLRGGPEIVEDMNDLWGYQAELIHTE